MLQDRTEAGRRLAEALADRAGESPVVLALPRGGVAVAGEIARRLAAPLDVVLVRKLGSPWQPELAIGAVVDGDSPETVLNDELVDAIGVPASYIEAETKRQLALIAERRQRYQVERRPVTIAGSTVIVVDDGIATGATMRAALRAIRRAGPKRIVLAVPVAPAETVEELAEEADEIVCLDTPDPFFAIGAHYRDFRQVEDEEVLRLLHEANAAAKPSPPPR